MKHKNYTEILSLPPDALKKRQKTKGWALSFVGLIVYGILRLFRCKHGIQNAAVGGLRMLFFSICSAIRYWKRELFGAKTSYDSWWFEAQPPNSAINM